MAVGEQAQRLLASMLGLGARRLAVLAIVGTTVFAVVGLGAMYLSRADQEVLYAGLEPGDVGRIGAALNEAGIPFDVNAAGDTVLVKFGRAGQARMLLAEKGLPNSASAGYELFSELGSLGLTSFMQEVTRVRALEGEIARSIQLMKGVKAARVHLVLPDKGSFRRDRQPPSASVVLRTEMPDDVGSARAIRHLVAAAVPGMTLAQVTVLNTDGTVLAGGEGEIAAPSNLLGLEQTISREIRDNIRQTLTPYLGLENFQVSVAARLNTDRKQTSETIFDPESRIERSTRVIRANELSQNLSSETPTTVEQNLPEGEVEPGAGGEQSSAENERREELTNYELSSKTITTVSDGYGIDNLSIAVLIDRARLADSLGENATEADVDARLEGIRRLIGSAAGFDEARGDRIEVTAVEFFAEGRDLEPVPPLSLADVVARQAGTFINAGTILLVALLIIWFGLRPATKAILLRSEQARIAEQRVPGVEGEPTATADAGRDRVEGEEIDLIGDLTSKLQRSPQKRLGQIIDFDEQRAAAILRQWMHPEEKA